MESKAVRREIDSLQKRLATARRAQFEIANYAQFCAIILAAQLSDAPSPLCTGALGIDRLDPIKGIPHKLLAFAQLLGRTPSTSARSSSSRSPSLRLDVPLHQQLRQRLHPRRPDQRPLRLARQRADPLSGHHRRLRADGRAVRDVDGDGDPSLRDGMNLVSFEWVVCQQYKRGFPLGGDPGATDAARRREQPGVQRGRAGPLRVRGAPRAIPGAIRTRNSGAILGRRTHHPLQGAAEALEESVSSTRHRWRRRALRTAVDAREGGDGAPLPRTRTSPRTPPRRAGPPSTSARCARSPTRTTPKRRVAHGAAARPPPSPPTSPPTSPPAARNAVFTDYDGTLTPIVDDPDAALLPPAAGRSSRLSGSGVPTAIVSGRSRGKIGGSSRSRGSGSPDRTASKSPRRAPPTTRPPSAPAGASGRGSGGGGGARRGSGGGRRRARRGQHLRCRCTTATCPTTKSPTWRRRWRQCCSSSRA